MDSSLSDIDDALHEHERGFYHSTATDLWFRGERDMSPEWIAERRRLVDLYHVKYALKYPERMGEPKRNGILAVLLGVFGH